MMRCNYTNIIFICEDFDGTPKPYFDEVSELIWFDNDNLPDEIMPNDKEVLSDLNEFIADRQVIIR